MRALRAWDRFPPASLIFWYFSNGIWWFVGSLMAHLVWLCMWWLYTSWNCAEIALKRVCNVSSKYRDISGKYPNVSSKYPWPNPIVKRINMLWYASWSIRCESHAYLYQIRILCGIWLGFGESMQHRFELIDGCSLLGIRDQRFTIIWIAHL
jgi:hypothetical protein